MSGILAYGTYLPIHRLNRSELYRAGTRPTARSVAGFDEDTTSMAVEAARTAVDGHQVGALYFSTSAPALLDRTNATTIHAALDLHESVPAADLSGSVRSGATALRLGLGGDAPALIALADIRVGLPGSVDERDGGDGAAAFLVSAGDGPYLADYIGGASRSAEFLDRWRLPGELGAHRWDEQFTADLYGGFGEAALTEALAAALVKREELGWLLIATSNGRAARQVAKGLPAARTPRLAADVGDTGTAHPGLLLAEALDTAKPGETIALLVLTDGAEAFIFRTTDQIADNRRKPKQQEPLEVDYPTYLQWRGLLPTEAALRPPPAAPPAPAAFRSNRWRLALHAGVCSPCGTRHLPPQQVCSRCRSTAPMDTVSMAGTPGTVSNVTIDRIAWSPHGPTTFVVVDFDGGGRLQCELTDTDPATVSIGDRVQMTFRRRYTTDGRPTYFWKARRA